MVVILGFPDDPRPRQVVAAAQTGPRCGRSGCHAVAVVSDIPGAPYP
jgi:hypothetical protein